MKKQELANKSGTEKKDELFQGRTTYRGSELGGDKLEDYFQQISPERSPERLLSILSAPELLHTVNASQKVNMISHLQQTYGNAYVQKAIQPKLKIGQPGDKYEQEADRVADQVMRMPEPLAKRQREDEKKKREEVEEILQPKDITGQTREATHELKSSLQTLKGGGQPFSKSVRDFFEPRFGCDFSRVRIHTGAQSNEISDKLNARAFTIGQDIFFRKELYSPSSSSGRELLAHELTHVVQQTGGLQRTLIVGQPEDKNDQEVDQTVQPIMQREQQRVHWGADEILLHLQQLEEEEIQMQVEEAEERSWRISRKVPEEILFFTPEELFPKGYPYFSRLLKSFWEEGSLKGRIVKFVTDNSDRSGLFDRVIWLRINSVEKKIGRKLSLKEKLYFLRDLKSLWDPIFLWTCEVTSKEVGENLAKELGKSSEGEDVWDSAYIQLAEGGVPVLDVPGFPRFKQQVENELTGYLPRTEPISEIEALPVIWQTMYNFIDHYLDNAQTAVMGWHLPRVGTSISIKKAASIAGIIGSIVTGCGKLIAPIGIGILVGALALEIFDAGKEFEEEEEEKRRENTQKFVINKTKDIFTKKVEMMRFRLDNYARSAVKEALKLGTSDPVFSIAMDNDLLQHFLWKKIFEPGFPRTSIAIQEIVKKEMRRLTDVIEK